MENLRKVLLVIVLLCVSSCVFAANSTIYNLNYGGNTVLTGINNARQVVGTYDHNVNDRAFFWENGIKTNLGISGSTLKTNATGINQDGVVGGYGYSSDTSYKRRGLIWDSPINNAIITTAGTSTENEYAYAVSADYLGGFMKVNGEQMAGVWNLDGSINGTTGLGGSANVLIGANGNNDFVGYGTLQGSTDQRAMIVSVSGSPLTVTDIGGNRTNSHAHGINDDATIVVGRAWNSTPISACLWEKNPSGGWDFVDLGNDGSDSIAAAISPDGSKVVGSLGGQAVIWEKIDGVWTSTPIMDLLPPGHSWTSLSKATGVNDSGDIVGNGYYNYFDGSSIQTGFVLLVSRHRDSVVNYGGDTKLTGINNAGQVVGAYDYGVNDRAFFWEKGVKTNLGISGSTLKTNATCINKDGVAGGYGYSSDTSYKRRGLIWGSPSNNAIITTAGTSTANEYAYAVSSDYLGGFMIVNGEQLAGVWNLDGTINTTVGLGGSANVLIGANSNNDFVGYGTLQGSTDQRAMIISEPTAGNPWIVVDLGGSRTDSHAHGINDDATIVVGRAWNSTPISACLWEKDPDTGIWNFVDLGNDGDNSIAAAISPDGSKIVGSLGGQAVMWEKIDGVWTSTPIMDLLPPGHSWTSLIRATGVNNSGCIVGDGYYDGQSNISGFVLEPLNPVPMNLLFDCYVAPSKHDWPMVSPYTTYPFGYHSVHDEITPVPYLWPYGPDRYEVLGSLATSQSENRPVGVYLEPTVGPVYGTEDPDALETLINNQTAAGRRLDFVLMDIEAHTVSPPIITHEMVQEDLQAVIDMIRNHPDPAINQAYIGNYQYSPGHYAGTGEYYLSNNDLNVAMPELYAWSKFVFYLGGPTYGDPNYRTSLFSAPLEILSAGVRDLPKGNLMIPFWGGFYQSGYGPTDVTAPPREDTEHLLQHVRLRGADGYYMYRTSADDGDTWYDPALPDDTYGNENFKTHMLDAWQELDWLFVGVDKEDVIILNLETREAPGLEWSGVQTPNGCAVLISYLGEESGIWFTFPDIDGYDGLVPENDPLPHPNQYYVHKGEHVLLIAAPGEVFSQESPSVVYYDFTGVSRATNDHYVYACDVDKFPFDGRTSNRNSKVEATDAQYVSISADNASQWETVDPGFLDEMFLWIEMKIDDVADITQIDFTFNGNSDSSTTNHGIYVLKAGADWWLDSSWVYLGPSQSISADVDTAFTRSITANISEYIDSNGKIIWGVYQQDNNSDDLRINYLKMLVHY